MIIEKHLRTALEKNEFDLYYQPQLDVKTNRVSGFEALIRWKNPELGLVPPSKFISIAEDIHMIIPIGQWVVRNACLFLKKLHRNGYTNLTVSVNASILQLMQNDFADSVLEILETVKLDPEFLEVEVTESVLMESYDLIAAKLKMMRTKGIRIALDDFGKGYSSLNYLRHLPISTLKIDKSFIDTISVNDRKKSLTDLIVRIGKNMGLCVIAEGVETQEQMDYLVKHKCDKIQGYLFCKPAVENEILERVGSML
jgi:EAL domain-containing protein (putative c-di-GMP-specific phosphodiesterase class I)